jgi:histidine phosphotransferase ChpT
MTANILLDDTGLAALISSKICHDLAGQIGAINNGLELLEEETDEDTRYYALELIHNSAKAAWAQLDFNRLAFGVASSLGAVVPLGHVEQVARRHLETAKRKLHWKADVQEVRKDHAKLLLAVLAVAVSALPAGGDLFVEVKAREGGPPSLKIACRGRSARIPEGVAELLGEGSSRPIDGRLVGAYYARRLAEQASLRLEIAKEGADVVFTVGPRSNAKPRRG